MNNNTTKNLTAALQALAKASEGPDKTLGKALEKLGSSDSFLTAPSLVRFFRTAERAKKDKDYTTCKTALQIYCHDETVQTTLDASREGEGDTLDENG